MTSEKEASTDFDSNNLISFLYIKRRPLLIITFTAAVISAIASFFIVPKFKSTVILFPTTTSSISKSLLSENTAGKHDIMQFGEEAEAEQILQILNSDEIRSKIVDKYDLLKHYEIDTGSQYKMTELFNEFQSNISFKRTEFMSIKIEVLDKDPVKAANIANDIAALLDTAKNRIQRERAMQGFRIVEQEYQNFKNQIKATEDALEALRKFGIFDYESQAEVYSEQYAIAVLKGDKSGVKSLEEKLKILADYGGAYISMRDNLEHDRKQLRVIKTKYEEAKVDAEQNITHKFIVNNAFPAERKSYPIRWLVVAVSTISALLLGILLIIGMESFKKQS